jgi:hypothetical protein
MNALLQRRQQCRLGYEFIINDVSDKVDIKLADGTIVTENDVSDQLLIEINASKSYLSPFNCQ